MPMTPSPIRATKGTAQQFAGDIEALGRAHAHARIPGRNWWVREHCRYPRTWHKVWKHNPECLDPSDAFFVGEIYSNIHPGVLAALDTWGWPTNPRSVALLEYPHVPTNGDRGKVAYTMSDKHGEADRQTVITLGKYLTRQWPGIADHEVRDLAARFSTPALEIWATKELIISAVEFGPRSCMQSGYGSIPFSSRYDHPCLEAWTVDKTAPEPAWDKHPYAVYDPALGWSIAVIVEWNGKKGQGVPNVLSRCLLWQNPDNDTDKVFVRSYLKSSSDGGYSHDSVSIESQLRELGWRKRDQWPEGATFRRINHPSSRHKVMMPYLDGDSDGRSVYECGEVMVKIDDADDAPYGATVYNCANTDGSCDEGSRYTWTCHDCGEQLDDDDRDDSLTVGRHEDTEVCRSCSDNYTLVRGTTNNDRWNGYREYYIPENDAADVRGQDYMVDPAYVPDGVVELEDGYYADLDDTVCINDWYYMTSDVRVVELVDECNDSMYALKDDCWQDAEGNWHHDDQDYIIYDGEKYREDSCWQDDVTGWWYPDFVDQAVDPETGDTVHPDYLEPCSRAADFHLEYAPETVAHPAPQAECVALAE